MYFGFFASSMSFLLGTYYFIQRLAGATHAGRGYASTIVVVLFLGGVQLICLGVIGEYIGRIYDEVKQRPLYIIARSTGFRSGVGVTREPSSSSTAGDPTDRVMAGPPPEPL
jgi:polyisoprenyl-phosphate glycosyltransferase